MGKERRRKERYEVLFEDIKSRVQVVLEGRSILDRKIDALRQDVGGVKEELGHVEQAVTEGNQHLETLIKRFEAHDHAHTS